MRAPTPRPVVPSTAAVANWAGAVTCAAVLVDVPPNAVYQQLRVPHSSWMMTAGHARLQGRVTTPDGVLDVALLPCFQGSPAATAAAGLLEHLVAVPGGPRPVRSSAAGPELLVIGRFSPPASGADDARVRLLHGVVADRPAVLCALDRLLLPDVLTDSWSQQR